MKADKVVGGVLVGACLLLVVAACVATAMEGTDALRKAREVLEAGVDSLKQAEKEQSRKAKKPTKA